MLDVVELGEFSTVVRSGVILELASGLAAKVASINKEEDSSGIGEFDKAIDKTDGGVGLATARSHLYQGAWSGFGEGLFQVRDSFNLAVPETLSYQRRQILKSGSEGVLLGEPFVECLRFVEAEDAAGPKLWIPEVAKHSLDAGAFIGERRGSINMW